MSCHRSRDNWHSYVRNRLEETVLCDMSAHVKLCAECREIVSGIQETTAFLANNRTVPSLPSNIKINVMAAININKYNYKSKKMSFSDHFDLKNWGLSLVATGLILITVNMTPLAHNLRSETSSAIFPLQGSQLTVLNTKIGRGVALPFDKMSMAVHAALGKIETYNGNAKQSESE